MRSLLSGPLSIEELLQHKALGALGDAQHKELARLSNLKVDNFSEADVREEIISPLLWILGYDKQHYFSIEREKRIQFPGRNNQLDYNLTLWSENFWLIEAKKPTPRKKEGFAPADVRQVFGYSVHPDINAALAVLCDGRRLAVFDREENILEPALTVEIANLQRDIDQLRAVLGPWQIWFFEKRRIVRHLDKVFNKEFNITRLEEFKSLVDKRLDSKRTIVIDNMRLTLEDGRDAAGIARVIRESEPSDLIEGAFFLTHSVSTTRAIAETLVQHCRSNSFAIVSKVFPYYARNMTDDYCIHSLNFLIHLSKSEATVNWLPDWLGRKGDPELALKGFIESCLTYFSSDPIRRGILLCSVGLRRLFKALMVVDESVWSLGNVLHVMERYIAPEDSLSQVLSSPERQNLLRLDGISSIAVSRLVEECSNERGEPKFELIERRLREMWEAEASIVESVPSYPGLLEARRMEENHPTEAIAVVYDYLGHGSLCVVNDHPKWKAYILNHHADHLEVLERMGSWQAQKWIEGKNHEKYQIPDAHHLADRFFLGDVDMYYRLRTAYGCN